ncbi:hypothetical protein EMGBS15_18160 [Filimonas sp.]|nr:hypothetical protein EMGBS15_18160 [Filimonas sp.]
MVKSEVVKIVSYEVLENGDTINKVDSHDMQQGKWLIEHPAHYEETGTMEVGNFENGIRSGTWKTYTMQGLLESEENFKKGLKDGEARYYVEGGLYCIGNYLALNAKQLYDTVMVEDAVTNEFRPIKIKTDVGSIRHGMWTFYEPRTKQIKRVVEYQADDVVSDSSYNTLTKTDSLFILAKMKSFPHVTKKPDENVWMGKGHQERVKYTDIPDDRPVKPNVRKK